MSTSDRSYLLASLLVGGEMAVSCCLRVSFFAGYLLALKSLEGRSESGAQAGEEEAM